MVTNSSEQKKGFSRNILRRQNISRLILLLLILAGMNMISSFVFTRFDLTSEKRFTLSPVTKNLVGNLKDIVYVKVYLDGDFPRHSNDCRMPRVKCSMNFVPIPMAILNMNSSIRLQIRMKRNGINYTSNWSQGEFSQPACRLRVKQRPPNRLFFQELSSLTSVKNFR